MSNKFTLSRGLMAAASVSMLVACGPAPTTTTSPSPSATPTPIATATPVATPTPIATATPVATPTPIATATPVATPTPAGTATPMPTATPTTNASATSDISVIEKTTLNGKVFDDTNAPLDGVTIRAKSLNSSVPFDATGTTSGGSYAFNNVPSGVTIEISASRAGYTNRRRVEVLKSNKTGDPNANRYDFGNDGSGTTFGVSYNALSDKPEVNTVTPGRNASGIDPKTSFVLKFSEPMDKATVQDNFEVYTFNNKKFTVDTSNALSSVTGPGDVNLLTGTRIWDKAAFTVSWNSDDTEATFTFKEERLLPTDRDSAKTPDYQVSLNRQDGAIKDKSGISRGTAEKKFKLTDGDFERSYKFSIKTDEKKPTVDSLVAQTAENSGANSDGDAIKVRFSERMIHYTLGPTIAGGMGGVTSQAAGANNALTGDQVAPNYKVTVIRQAVTQFNQTTWGALGGRAIFDTNDPTHKTVILLPGTASSAKTVAGNVTTGQTLTGTFTYSDGTTEAVTATITVAGATATYAELQTGLNALVTAGTPFTATEVSNVGVAGSVTAGDTYTVTLAANAKNFANTKFITAAVFNGGSAATNLAITAGAPLQVYPGSAAGAKPDLYKPGDNVIVKVDTTVLDPAGNSVDSSGDNASANAS